MNLTILNTNLEAVLVLDAYMSFIWTDRYNLCGDFELYTTVDSEIIKYIRQDYYILNDLSEHVMIIEQIRITSDYDDGNRIIITGRSLESLLDRRIVWGQKTIFGNFQNGIKALLDDSIISPQDANRKISNFIFESSTDPKVTNINVNTQFTGDSVYEAIRKLCEEHNLGFKITLSNDNKFIFKLYAGVDKSYSQNTNAYVVFSPKFENILNSNYIETKQNLKTITLVGGEGEGNLRKYTSVGGGSGVNRRELFTDARDISSMAENNVTLSNADYLKLLQRRGYEKLSEYTEHISFEGQVETTIIFKYGEDFFIGDIVQITNEYGHETSVRISEIIITNNEQGFFIYPTFKTINNTH